jgi:hypothetical protein
MRRLLLAACCLAAPLCAEETAQLFLNNPRLVSGVIETDEGGIIQTSEIRVQAQEIRWDQKNGELDAQGDLMLEYRGRIFVGSHLHYNIQTGEGVLDYGRAHVEGWYLGGDQIHFQRDGNYVLHGAFLTTCERSELDWAIRAPCIRVMAEEQVVSAHHPTVRFWDIPVLWLPGLKMGLKMLDNWPIRYQVQWGGIEGTRLSMIYRLWSGSEWNGGVRLDYTIKRGFGGGFDLDYQDPDRDRWLETRSYWARDVSILNPHDRNRYRFQGHFWDQMPENISIELMWDKQSDPEMDRDYRVVGFQLEPADRSQLQIRHTGDWSITDGTARIRANPWQTEVQALPMVTWQHRPYTLGDSGVILEDQFSAGFLSLLNAEAYPKEKNIQSVRLGFDNRLYRPLQCDYLEVTPEVGAVGFYYNEAPRHRKDAWVVLGRLGGEVHSNWSRVFGDWKHRMTPYLNYQWLTAPVTPVNEHYIFGIEDGLNRLSLLRFGMRQQLFARCDCQYLEPARLDIYGLAFFNQSTIGATVPRMYLDAEWSPLSQKLIQTTQCVWNIEHGLLDRLNVGLDWTITEDLAWGGAYRHRSRYDWRKADPRLFFLDTTRPEDELLHSALSDQRDILLLRAFYRFHPNIAIQTRWRSGWNRVLQPGFHEWRTDLYVMLRCRWMLHLMYEHTQVENRWSVNVSLSGIGKRVWKELRQFAQGGDSSGSTVPIASAERR